MKNRVVYAHIIMHEKGDDVIMTNVDDGTEIYDLHLEIKLVTLLVTLLVTPTGRHP